MTVTVDKPQPTPELDAKLAVENAQMREAALNIGLPAYALPELNTAASDIHDRLVEAEKLFSPDGTLHGYTDGTAVHDDDLVIRHHGDTAIVTAEHATSRIRDEKMIRADHGVGALALVAAKEVGGLVVAPLGMQTSDANSSGDEHKINQFVNRRIQTGNFDTFTSIHGMSSGHFLPGSFRADRIEASTGPYDVMLGVGHNPSNETIDLADRIVTIGAEMGLLVGVNQPFLRFNEDGTPMKRTVGEDDEYYVRAFRAAGGKTSRATAERNAAAISTPLASVQIELSELLRILPEEVDPRKNGSGSLDRKRIAAAVYTGYKLVEQALKPAI